MSAFREGEISDGVVSDESLGILAENANRKTGLTLKEGQRDEFGLELIDGIFSSPAPPPPKPTGPISNGGIVVRGAERDQQVDSRVLGVAQTTPLAGATGETNDVFANKGLRSAGRTSLPPPRARSPIKTKLNSPPRRPPSAGPSPSPFQRLNGTPKRGFPHPSPAVRRRLNFSEDTASPSVPPVRSSRLSESPRRIPISPPKFSNADHVSEEGEDGRPEISQRGGPVVPSPRSSSEARTDQQYGADGFTFTRNGVGERAGQTGRGEGNVFQREHDVGPEAGEFDDMDDSIQLVQYENHAVFDAPNQHNYTNQAIPTPRAVPPRPLTESRRATDQQDIASPRATTFAVKRGRGRPPKPRTLVYRDFRDSDPEDEGGRPRKVTRHEDSSYPRDPYGSSAVSSLQDPFARMMSTDKSTALVDGASGITPKRGPGRPRKVRDGQSDSTPITGIHSTQASHQNSASGDTPKRGPGRPRKVREGESGSTPVTGMLSTQASHENGASGITPKRGPGRPRKVREGELDSTPVTGMHSTQVSRENGINRGQVVKRGPGRPRKTESLSNSVAAVLRGEWQRAGREGMTDDRMDQGSVDEHYGPVDPVLLAESRRERTVGNATDEHEIPQRRNDPPPRPMVTTTTAAAAAAAITTNSEANGPPKRGRGRPKGSKNKPKFFNHPGGIGYSGVPSSSSAAAANDGLPEPWEEEPGIFSGAVKLWDADLESSLDYLVEDEIAYSAQALDTRHVANGSFRYAKTLTMPFFGAGVVELPPAGVKRAKNARKWQMVFFVAAGKVLVEIAGNSFRIGRGGMWQVPRG